MNNKQREITTEFCHNHMAGRKGKLSDEKVERVFGELMAMHHASATGDYVMMGLVYENLSTKVKYHDLLIGVAMQVCGGDNKLSSTSETTGAAANYRKRLNVLIDYADRLAGC